MPSTDLLPNSVQDCRPFPKGEVGGHLVRLDDDCVLPVREGILLDIRIELVAPSEAARFARAASNASSNDRPIPWPVRLQSSAGAIRLWLTGVAMHCARQDPASISLGCLMLPTDWLQPLCNTLPQIQAKRICCILAAVVHRLCKLSRLA